MAASYLKINGFKISMVCQFTAPTSKKLSHPKDDIPPPAKRKEVPQY